MRVAIIGTGYVGLVTGACLAAKGHRVVCVDVDPGRVASLNAATAPFFEAGLNELLLETVGRGLSATTDLAAAVSDSDLTLIAVGTPFNGSEIDLTAVLRAAREVGAALRRTSDYRVVVVKSTVVPGTTDTDVIPALEEGSGKRAGVDFGVGMNPEFLSEGEAVRDFMFPDRIVLGGIDDRSLDVMARLYEPFEGVPHIRTNTRTAEMIKYASNALLATLISFSNEFANLGATLGGIDTVDVMRGVRLSQYFSPRSPSGVPPITAFLAAGCGFGGSCLPKDVKALIAHGRRAGESMRLLESVIRINDDQPGRVISLLEKHWPSLNGIAVTVLGLAFKPGTSDVRESPAFPLMRALLDRGAVVSAFDPVATPDAMKVLPDPRVTYCDSLEAALSEARAVVVVTPWDEFQDVPALLKDRAESVVFVDARRAFEKASVATYEGIGL